jgi:hypothetical protein
MKNVRLCFIEINYILRKTVISNIELLCAGTVWLYSCSVWGEIIQVIFTVRRFSKIMIKKNK